MPHRSLALHSEGLLIPTVLFVLGAILLFFVKRDTGRTSLLIACLSIYIVTLFSVLLGILIVLLLHGESETFWWASWCATLFLPLTLSAIMSRENWGKSGTMVMYRTGLAVTASLILFVSGLLGSLYAFK